jgi:CRP-like cAMP-binding protein
MQYHAQSMRNDSARVRGTNKIDTMHAKFIQLIKQHCQLSEPEIDLCKNYMEPVRYAKHQIIEEEERYLYFYLYFVVSGFVRLFHYNDKGDELTTHINCPPGFICSYQNFSNQTRSEENRKASPTANCCVSLKQTSIC